MLQVITEDGYILKLWRFQEGRSEASKMEGETKQPVFIQHGVLMVITANYED